VQYRHSFYLSMALAALEVVVAVVFVRPIAPRSKNDDAERRTPGETNVPRKEPVA